MVESGVSDRGAMMALAGHCIDTVRSVHSRFSGCGSVLKGRNKH